MMPVSRTLRHACRLFYEDDNIASFIRGENEFNIPDIVAKKQVVIFNLYGLDDEITAFIGCLVSNAIKSYYLHQTTRQSKPLYFYCDEHHLFIKSLISRFGADVSGAGNDITKNNPAMKQKKIDFMGDGWVEFKNLFS